MKTLIAALLLTGCAAEVVPCECISPDETRDARNELVIHLHPCAPGKWDGTINYLQRKIDVPLNRNRQSVLDTATTDLTEDLVSGPEESLGKSEDRPASGSPQKTRLP
jgi:hypothetical protein